MKTIILAAMFLPIFASAQSFVVKEISGKTYGMPMLNFFDLKETKEGYSCTYGKFLIEDAVKKYTDNDCKAKPEDYFCKSIKTTVQKFNALNGTETFSIEPKVLDEQKAINGIMRDFNLKPEDVKVFLPDYSKITFEMDFEVVDQENFYVKLAEVFQISPTIRFAKEGKEVLTNGRLASCAIKDKAIIFSGEYTQTENVKVQPSALFVTAAQNYYEEVAKAWKEEEKRAWKNDIHKILSIGVILKEKSKIKNLDTLSDMTVSFDKFFTAYNKADGDEGVSVYLNEFKTTEEFKAKVTPSKNEVLSYRAFLRQEQ
jgi:hypothetical protein